MTKAASQPLFLRFYAVAFHVAAGFLRAVSFGLPKMRRQWEHRQVSPGDLDALRTQRECARRGILFFCSSAGEYEQAKPLVDRYSQDAVTMCVIVFFSVSGFRFAAARSETIPCLLMPTDDPRFWVKLFQAFRPELTCVVRHELWPGFLHVARAHSRLVLINGTVDGSRRPLRDRMKGWLLRLFHGVAVVSSEDELAFRRFGMPSERIEVTGDTKFDRVIERASANRARADRLKEQLDARFGQRFRLIVGSAWEPEVTMALKAYRALMAQGAAADWQLVIAPHDVSERMVRSILETCSDAGLSALRFSSLEAAEPGAITAPILIVDRIGYLAELYGSGQLAFVGGALNGKVHNVLEPASYGMYVAMGPRFSTSREAVMLEREGLITVIESAEQLLHWWSMYIQSEKGAANTRLKERIHSLAGAADRLMAWTEN